MIRDLFLVIFALLLGGCNASEKRVTRIAMAGSGSDSVIVIDKATKEIVMKIPLPPRDAECNSVEVDQDGSILFSYRRGVRLVSRHGLVVWDLIRENDKEEMQSATFTSEGVVVGVCGHPSKIIEVRGFGDKVKIIEFESGIESVHGQFRQIKKAKNGNYLVPFMSKRETWEIDSTGKTVKVYPEGGFSVVELESGDLMIPNKVGVVVLSRTSGDVVREYKVPQGSFITEVNMLKNGNLLVSNWQGYRNKDTELQWMLVEVDPQGNVVWQYKNDKEIRLVSALHQFEGLVED